MNFNLYSYKYNCPRWYGTLQGVKNLYINKKEKELSHEQVIKMAKNQSNTFSGSNSCSVTLLNKFDVSIKSVETYPSLTGINFKK